MGSLDEERKFCDGVMLREAGLTYLDPHFSMYFSSQLKRSMVDGGVDFFWYI